MTMKAFIFCGGRGERLKPITDNVPKPMVPVAGKPILEYQLDLLKKHGVRDAVLLVGWHGEAVEKYFGDGSQARHAHRIFVRGPG